MKSPCAAPGGLRVRNDNNDIVFDIDPYTGNTFTEGGLTVTGETIFAGARHHPGWSNPFP